MVLLFCQYTLNAQTDTQSKKQKPSWAEAMPERPNAPDLNIDNSLDATIELDMGDYDLRREQNTDPDVEDTQEQSTELKEAEAVTESQRLEQEQKTVQKLAEQKRLAYLEKNREEQRLAEQARQAALVATQQRQAQQEAERQRVAAQRFEQKQQATDAEITEESLADESTATITPKPVVETVPYQWKKIKNVSPEYPAKAARGKKSGWVNIAIIIDSSGTVIDAQILSTYNDYTVFNKSALKAVRKWKYDPPNKYGIHSNQSKIVKIIFEY